MQKKSVQTESPADDDAQVLTISPEKVCFAIIKAREYDAKDEVTEVDPGSNPSDDKDVSVLEDHEDDPVVLRAPVKPARTAAHRDRTGL
jgi:hypothetical protein